MNSLRASLVLLVLTSLALFFEMRDETFRLRLLAYAAAAFLAALPIAAELLARRGRISRQLRDNVSLSVAAIAVSLACLEVMLRFALPWLPPSVRMLASEASTFEARQAMIQKLPVSPFFTFKANSEVRSMGERGDDFVYQWKTDRFGFKNAPQLADQPSMAVALGDSFTEGMGVATQDTWPAKLTTLGIPTYNLGVQGYSSSQMLGALVLHGLAFKPRYCLIGYTGTIFSREERYKEGPPNALASDLQERHEIKRLNRLVLLALLRAAQKAQSDKDAPKPLQRPVQFAPMRPWMAEISSLSVISPDAIAKEPSWRATLERIGAMARLCQEANAKATLLIYFPHRATVYYTAATGAPLPENAFEIVESAMMAEFARAQGIAFLNLLPDFLRRTAALSPDSPSTNYPFLMLDGHPSPSGQALIAEAVAAKLKHLEQP
jgi:lysophospholipase L1-like esterase